MFCHGSLPLSGVSASSEVEAELQVLSKGNRCTTFLDALPAAFQARFRFRLVVEWWLNVV